MGPEKCLLCYEHCSGGYGDADEDILETAVINKELYAVFVLRNIFEVPDTTLEEYLEETGQNPSEWITICESCKSYVEKAKRVYKEILEAKRRFRKVKGDLVQLVRRNKRRMDQVGVRTSRKRGMRVTDETRQFVHENNYSGTLVDPYIEGDTRAEKLLYSSNVVGDVDVFEKPVRKVTPPTIVKIESLRYEEPEDQDEFLDADYGEGEESQLTFDEDWNENSTEEQSEYTPSSPPPERKKNDSEKNGKNDSDFGTHENLGCKEDRDGKKRWHCRCGIFFTTNKRACRHVKEGNMNPAEMFSCPKCDKRYKRLYELKLHVLKTHSKDSLSLLDKYSKSESDNKIKISKSFPRKKSELEVHGDNGTSETSDGDIFWYCLCGRKYTSNDKLRRHIRECNMDKSEMRPCPLCDKIFKRGWDVKRHLKNFHKGEHIPKKVKLASIGILPGQRIPGVHKKCEENCEMEDGTKYWTCTCGKIFLSEATLQEHVEKHAAETAEVEAAASKIICADCGLEFRRRVERNMHMKKVHGLTNVAQTVEVEENGGNDEEEEDSDFEEDDDYDEDNHAELGMFVNADGSEFWKCKCGREYLTQTSLHRHVVEMKMDPDSLKRCTYCEKTFKRTSQVKRHESMVHEKTAGATCDRCGKTLCSKAKLKDHQRRNFCTKPDKPPEQMETEEANGDEEVANENEEIVGY